MGICAITYHSVLHEIRICFLLDGGCQKLWAHGMYEGESVYKVNLSTA
jgi:hypothetical protein